jgi:hypothetical protein
MKKCRHEVKDNVKVTLCHKGYLFSLLALSKSKNKTYEDRNQCESIKHPPWSIYNSAGVSCLRMVKEWAVKSIDEPIAA